MLSSPFFRRLFVPYLLVICGAIATVGFFAARELREGYLERTRAALRDQSQTIATLVADPLKSRDASRVQSALRALHQSVDCRVTVIDGAGRVVADNEADPATMENHGDRPEILAAHGSGEGDAVRPSATLHEPMFYYARRLSPPPGEFYLRLSQHVASLDRQIHALYTGLAVVALLAALAAGGIGYFVARRETRPVLELTDFANALARGEFGRRYLRDESGEIATLASALNGMADSLSGFLTRKSEDTGRLLAILGSMNEGVIAADTGQRILFTNESAGRLLGFGVGANGQLLWETVRSDAVLKLARDVLAADDSASGRATIHVGPLLGRHLEVTACTFPPDGKPEGLILVAHDTTQSVQYQELRKEFVANVSHELRTPLSVIKGFAETLREGAMNDPKVAGQYLATIEKHADQLTNLVSDLLELSRLDGQVGLKRKTAVNLGALIRRVGDLLAPVAERKRQKLSIELPADLPQTLGNADYLERAITNLVDNAIKYTPEGGEVTVRARATSSDVIVEIHDNGIGIPANELPRIFERFYRVDRSRSRELGGTGLGLSIVKHVAQTHGGFVDVESEPGHGSTFRLSLPLMLATSPA